jgi:hypothetical protein
MFAVLRKRSQAQNNGRYGRGDRGLREIGSISDADDLGATAIWR